MTKQEILAIYKEELKELNESIDNLWDEENKSEEKFWQDQSDAHELVVKRNEIEKFIYALENMEEEFFTKEK
jgi:hypothetical protein